MKKILLHEKREFENIREMIEEVGDMYSASVAFRFRENPHDKECQKKSYSEFRDDVRSLATFLITRNLAGKNIVLIGKSSYPWMVTYFAVMAAGAVLCPLDRDWSAEELADTIKNADGEMLICDQDQKGKVETIRKICPTISDVAYIDGEENTFDNLLRLGKEKFSYDSSVYYNAPIDPDVLSLLVFTSGTTGKGKGVMLTQRNILSDVTNITPYLAYSPRSLHVLPPHHTYGSSISILGQVTLGVDVYISSGTKYVLKEMKEQKPGHLVVVPLYVETFYRKILSGIKATGKEKVIFAMMKVSNLLRKIGIDLRKKLFGKILEPFGGEVNMMICGGAPLNQEMANLFDSIGVSILNGYGITECAPCVAVNYSNYIHKKSVGAVVDINEVKIDEPNENGEGEILVKGTNVMLGYYKNPEATADAFTDDGYFRTGDYGRLVHDKKYNRDRLYITGRKKNLIILANGKNVYPEEIEDALSATPGVLELIAYEGKSRRGDAYNTIVLEVFPDSDFIKKNEIEDFAAYFQNYVSEYNKTCVPYKKIGIVKVRDEEFPKNTLRKILRFKLDTTID